MNRLVLFLLVLGGAVAYLAAWPVAVQPVAWLPAPSAGYAGPHALNFGLAALQPLPLDGDSGPEHVVVRAEEGRSWVWAAVTGSDSLSGRIVRMRPDGGGREVVVDTGGRPLGFDFDASGALIVADPMFGRHGGLLRVSGRGVAAKIELLTDQMDGEPIRYANAVAVAADGRIYFSDSSRRFGAKATGSTFEASVLDILEQQCSGRVGVYDPATQLARVLKQGLCFPNGVVLTEDGRHLLVAETGAHRIWKLSLSAAPNTTSSTTSSTAPAASSQLLLEGLPGYPDNLMRGQNGRYWVGLVKPRSAFADSQAQRPWLRALALRLPRAWWPVPPAYGHVIAFDDNGKVVADLQDNRGSYPETSGVTETADRLYIHSLNARSLGYRIKGPNELR